MSIHSTYLLVAFKFSILKKYYIDFIKKQNFNSIFTLKLVVKLISNPCVQLKYDTKISETSETISETLLIQRSVLIWSEK